MAKWIDVDDKSTCLENQRGTIVSERRYSVLCLLGVAGPT
jgi:hypothetical protein